MDKLLQIVPRLPPAIDGIGDYSLQLARRLRQDHQISTCFVIGDPTWSGPEELEGFPLAKVESRSAAALLHQLAQAQGDLSFPLPLLVHYVGYGYQERGIPLWLRQGVLRYQRPYGDRGCQTPPLLIMFHELVAAGPITSSAFWLRPLQSWITYSLAHRSRACFVSNERYRSLLSSQRIKAPTVVVPVASNFGEPQLTEVELVSRALGRWIICGGTGLVEKSLRSFLPLIPHLPEPLRPVHLDIVGGYNNPAVKDLLPRCQGFSVNYTPQVSVQQASDLLRQASFAWIDYFGPGRIWPALITKSTAFAACSAHGVLSVFSHHQTYHPPGLEQSHPPIFYLGQKNSRLPDLDQIASLRQAVYQWYQTHSSTQVITQAYANVLQAEI